MNKDVKSFIVELINHQIIKFGEFTLKSGDVSPFYIDLRLLPSYPSLFKQSVDLYTSLLSSRNIDFDHVAGLISAGVPFATGISINTNTSLLQVRSSIKSHGRKRMIEGRYTGGQSVILLDDVISTGVSKLRAVDLLKEAKLKCIAIVVMIDRRTSEEIGTSLRGIEVLSIFSLQDILDAIETTDRDTFKEDIDLETIKMSLTNWSRNS